MPKEKLHNVTIRTMQGDIKRLQKGEEILSEKLVPLVSKKTVKEDILEKARQERIRVKLEREPIRKQELEQAEKLAEETRIKQEEIEKKRNEEEAKRKQEEGIKIKQKEEARIKQEEIEKKRNEEEARIKQEEEIRRKQEEARIRQEEKASKERERKERTEEEAKRKLWQEKFAQAEEKAEELVFLEEAQYTEKKKAERELWAKKIILAKEKTQELVRENQQKQEEVLDKKNFSLGTKIGIVQDKLKTIPEEERPIELLIQEQKKKVVQLQEEQKRIASRLQNISLLKEEVEKEETSAQVAGKRREAEKKRWALADKEKEVEKLGWQKNDETKEATAKLEEAKGRFLSLSEKKALLEEEKKELIDAKQVVNLRQEKIALDKKALQLEKLKKLPHETLQQLDQQKDHLQKLLREILSQERDVEIENRDIEEEIQKTKSTEQTRELTQRSWKIEEERQSIEQKRWRTEEEIGGIEEKITKAKPEYQELKEEGEQLLKRKRDVEILLKFGIEDGNEILREELNEESSPVKKEETPSPDDLEKKIDSPKSSTKSLPGKRLLEKIRNIPKKKTPLEKEEPHKDSLTQESIELENVPEKTLPIEKEEPDKDSLAQKEIEPEGILETKIEANTETVKQETSSSPTQEKLMQRLRRGGTPEEKARQRFLSRVKGQEGEPEQPEEIREKTDIRKALEAKIKANMNTPQEEKGVQGEPKKDQKKENPLPKSSRGKLIQQLVQNSASEEKERQRFLSRVKGWKKDSDGSDLSPKESFGKQPEIIYRSKTQRTSRVQKITLRILIVLIIIALGVVIYLILRGYLI